MSDFSQKTLDEIAKKREAKLTDTERTRLNRSDQFIRNLLLGMPLNYLPTVIKSSAPDGDA
jgi:hypothetical protein